jgi:predicted dehydrogenase
MSEAENPSRRTFIAAAATSAGIAIVPRHVLGQAQTGEKPPSEKLNVASIGCGGMGFNDISNVGNYENVVAICDVDQRHITRAAKKFPKAVMHADFRKMLDEQKDIDAVMVATPDHLHAVASMAAMKHGKHVYCQKPLTHTVHEARAIREAASRYKVATQMGNQFQASEGHRVVCEMVWDGAIGKPLEIHAGSNRRPDISQRGVARPKDQPPVPEYLNWDLWVGPSPMRPYHPSYLPFTWRGWWDFGSGVLGDIGCHQLFTGFMAFNLGLPTAVESCSSNWQQKDEVSQETAPVSSITRFYFPAGKMPDGSDRGPITITWYDGGMKPPRPEEYDSEKPWASDDFTMYVGDKGKIYGHRLMPEKRQKEYGKPPKKLERVRGQYEEWLDAIKAGKIGGGSHFGGLASIVTETILLGNIAIRTNERLEYDGAAGRFKNSEKANALISPPYRAGWTL